MTKGSLTNKKVEDRYKKEKRQKQTGKPELD